MRLLTVFFILITNLYSQSTMWVENLSYGIQARFPYKEKKEIFSKSSDTLFLAGMYSKVQTNYYLYEVNFHLGGNEKETFLYLKENTYFQFSKGNAHLAFGRKQHLSPKQFREWKDGREGIGIDFSWRDSWKIQIDLLDYYRGFPLLEKEFAREKQEIKKGHRFRHGLEFGFENEFHSAFFSFRYLNLGNWGKYSQEVIGNQAGDRDFLYELGLQYEFENSLVLGGISLYLVRGLDKTQSHEIRSGSSLPFSGELVTAKLGFKYDFFFVEWRGFLPDRHKVNDQGEILESGYIGMGTYPFRGVILGQILEFSPSAWIKDTGLVFEQGYSKGFKYSYVNEFEIGVKEKNWKFLFFGTNAIPYSNLGTKKGTIRPFREEFSRYYLNEWGIEFRYDSKEKGGGFFSLQISQLFTSKEIGWNSTAAYLKGGIYF